MGCTHGRITPAGAGKTYTLINCGFPSEDHPRRCGENRLFCGLFALKLGSPPQVRGKPSREEVTFFLPRITPAGAGKTKTAEIRHRRHWDHPRRCGENYRPRLVSSRALGSPPQVRGKRTAALVRRAGAGITPAGAGKTPRSSLQTGRTGDHPRRCGENGWTIARGHTAVGSPPQVRGKPTKKMCPAPCIRITPAGAGKTLCSQTPTVGNTDHPRRCGENIVCKGFCKHGIGSPPQVRGKPAGGVASVATAGITPAGAGKTDTPTTLTAKAKDHPRRCGEN